MTALILLSFLAAAVVAVPIAHALLVAAMAAAATSDRVPLDLLVQQMVAQVQSFPLIAIPFFMLTGSLMMGGKLGQAIVGVLGDKNYDAIYASDIVRTQQTATPMSQYLGLPIQVLPGLREIQAGASFFSALPSFSR